MLQLASKCNFELQFSSAILSCNVIVTEILYLVQNYNSKLCSKIAAQNYTVKINCSKIACNNNCKGVKLQLKLTALLQIAHMYMDIPMPTLYYMKKFKFCPQWLSIQTHSFLKQ